MINDTVYMETAENKRRPLFRRSPLFAGNEHGQCSEFIDGSMCGIRIVFFSARLLAIRPPLFDHTNLSQPKQITFIVQNGTSLFRGTG